MFCNISTEMAVIDFHGGEIDFLLFHLLHADENVCAIMSVNMVIDN